MTLTRNCMLALAVYAVLAESGCLCCKIPSLDKKPTTTKVQDTLPVVCNPPYIRFGSGCCLDANHNGMCDADETAATSVKTILSSKQSFNTQHTTTARSTITTSIATTASTTTQATQAATTTTTRPLSLKAACAGKYSVSAGTVIFLYTDSCCGPLLPVVVNVKGKGYNIRYVNMGFPSDSDTKLLSCYYSSLSDIYVPQFICAGTGGSIFVTGFENAGTKITSFAKECKDSA
jgi:hypothetical protein